MIKNNTRYAGVAFDDVVNGEGLGAVFFTQYCPHHCEQCHNPETWSKSGGKEFTQDVVDNLMNYYNTVPFANRLTFSGGEPLSEFSSGIVLEILRKFKDKYPHKKVWLYTGCTFVDTGCKGLHVVVVGHHGIGELDGHIGTAECLGGEVLLVVNVDDTYNLVPALQGNLLYHTAHLAVAYQCYFHFCWI